MTRLLVVTAVDVEARGLARHLGLASVPGASWAHFAGGALEIVAAGLRAGHLDARAAAGRPELVISAGTCAALAPHLDVGTLVVPDAVLGPDGARRPTAPLPGLPACGLLVSVADVLTSAEAKSRLFLALGALAADMESATIVDWAVRRGVPAAVVRAVADIATRGVPADLSAAVDDGGRVRPLRAVSAVLARPRAAADALALRTATAAALKTVAAALAAVARSRIPSTRS